RIGAGTDPEVATQEANCVLRQRDRRDRDALRNDGTHFGIFVAPIRACRHGTSAGCSSGPTGIARGRSPTYGWEPPSSPMNTPGVLTICAELRRRSGSCPWSRYWGRCPAWTLAALAG